MLHDFINFLGSPQVINFIGSMTVIAPALLIPILGISSLLGTKVISERRSDILIRSLVLIGLFSACCMLFIMLATGKRIEEIEYRSWVNIAHDAETYQFAIKLVFDRLSIPLVILTFLLCGTIGAFASKYMHREPGYHRFFFLYAIFTVGMTLASLAGTIETLFIGWELVGLSSALLVGFFHERPSPVRNGLHIWVIYRISDAALVLAAIVMHHMSGHGDLHQLCGINSSWPDEIAKNVSPMQAYFVGSLLLIAAVGKSGLIPFSGWLPRAMEGPTPSSAVYYGALSVHLGAFLMLRISPLLDHAPVLCWVVIIIGLATAIFATLAARAQTDIKSSLAFASLTQVSIIFIEIGLSLYINELLYVALVHLLGHACLRTFQFIRAPNLLREHRQLVNALGTQVGPTGSQGKFLPDKTRHWLYRWALERGYLDSFLKDYIALPFVQTFKFMQRTEERWMNFLTGDYSASASNQQTNTNSKS